MNIIIILICLFFERYYQIGSHIRLYAWFYRYLNVLSTKWLAKKNMAAWVMLITAIVPLVLLTALLQIFFNSVLWGILGFIFNTLVLLYCLGPVNIKEQYHYYFTAKERGDMAAAYASLNTREPLVFDNAADMTRGMTEHILQLSNRHIIAILFWFLLFGAAGALCYRLVLEVNSFATKLDDFYQAVGQISIKVREYLDWIPVRILALCYAVAGNFVGSFSIWMRYALAKPEQNDEFLVHCGLAALGVKENSAMSSIDEDQEAINLIDRVLIVFLVILALMTVAHWLN